MDAIESLRLKLEGTASAYALLGERDLPALLREAAAALKPAEVSETTRRMIDLLVARDRVGLAKYGTTLDRTDLTRDQWLLHMVEELLDGAGYALAALRPEVSP